MNRIPSFYSRETTAADYLQARAPRELWATVITQAIDDIVKGPPSAETRDLSPVQALEFRENLRMAAQSWVADDANEPRRFVWVCEQLGLDVSAVRGEIKARLAAA